MIKLDKLTTQFWVVKRGNEYLWRLNGDPWTFQWTKKSYLAHRLTRKEAKALLKISQISKNKYCIARITMRPKNPHRSTDG